MTAEKKAMTIIAVGSGKGGVGKSTRAANLAVAGLVVVMDRCPKVEIPRLGLLR